MVKKSTFKLLLNAPVLFLALCFVGFSQCAQSNDFLKQIWSPYFTSYTVDDGLSQSTATIIIQDAEEFIWLQTPVGIDRFNGYQFESIPFDTSIERKPQLNISALLLDQFQRVLAISARGNIYRFDPERHRFVSVYESTRNLQVLKAKSTDDGQLYLFTNSGIKLFKISDNDIKSSSIPNSRFSQISHPRSVKIDKQNILWVGTSNGLVFSYDLSNNELVNHEFNRKYHHNVKDRVELSVSTKGVIVGFRSGELYRLTHSEKSGQALPQFKNISNQPTGITQILQTCEHHIWIATRGKGLYRIFLDDYSARQYKMQNNLRGSISSNNLYTLSMDRQGGLWIGAANGINYAQVEDNRFYRLGGNSAYAIPLSSPYVSSIMQDPNGKLLVGSHDAGLGVLSQYTLSNEMPRLPFLNQGVRYPYQLRTYPDPVFITSTAQESNTITWVGTREGVNWIDTRTGDLLAVTNDWKTATKAGVNTMLINGFEKLIVTNDSHFVYQNKDSELFEVAVPGANKEFQSYSIAGPVNGKYWFSSDFRGVIHEFNSKTLELTNIKPLTKEGYPTTGITALWVSPGNQLWIGTDSDGIIKYDLSNRRMSWWYKDEGLPHNDIYGIMGDKQQNIWITGNKGLTRLDNVTQRLQNYTVKDGLQSNEFNHQAIYRGEDGLLYFGGINGITIVDENVFTLNKHLPRTHIDGAFLITNNGLQRLITTNQRINDLDYKSNSLSFKIGAIDLLNADTNTFSYRLVGQGRDWVDLGKNRDITLLKLSPGEYELQVTSCNNEGSCNLEPAKVKFDIPPPPWLSIWAYIVYVSVLISLILYYLKRQKDKLNFEREMAAKERQIADELRELNILKDEFLTNTSHELRTPLNGIIGLSEVLAMDPVISDKLDSRESLAAINNCGRQLKGLVEDLLDFSQLQSKRLKLTQSDFDLSQLVEEVVLLLSPQASEHNLVLESVIPAGDYSVFADNNRIRQVLYNLVSNAIKFSDLGCIQVILEEQSDAVRVAVVDEGIGIPPELQNKIFFSFTQLDGSRTRNHGGVGLGLAISKDIIELHNSRLIIRSDMDEGAEFSFYLPKKDPHENH